jgi:acyl-CoA reductase-like NAD-dependent aldehyde dehydrogenase
VSRRTGNPGADFTSTLVRRRDLKPKPKPKHRTADTWADLTPQHRGQLLARAEAAMEANRRRLA